MYVGFCAGWCFGLGFAAFLCGYRLVAVGCALSGVFLLIAAALFKLRGAK